MANLIYSSIASLDGYIEDQAGNFQWAAPDEEVFSFLNDQECEIGTYLYGRRLYETMVYWEQDALDGPAYVREFQKIWKAANKIVYSRTLTSTSSNKTKLEREFDSSVIEDLKDTSERNITVGGAELAALAFSANLVDEYQIYLTPILVGGGKPSLPNGVHLDLELLEERRFQSGVVFLRYRVLN